MRINWKVTIIKLLTLIPIYTHSLLTDIHWSKWLNHENHICELTVKEISIEASSQHWTLLKKWKSEYLHKVSDVYHNNYLMQCLKVIYADGNRSLIHKRELSPWYITESCSRWEGSYILVTRCTILHFGNFAKAVWQHVSHLVSWYLHCAVLSDVCCEM